MIGFIDFQLQEDSVNTKDKPQHKRNIGHSDVSCSCLPDHSYSQSNKSKETSTVKDSSKKIDHDYNRVRGESSDQGMKTSSAQLRSAQISSALIEYLTKLSSDLYLIKIAQQAELSLDWPQIR